MRPLTKVEIPRDGIIPYITVLIFRKMEEIKKFIADLKEAGETEGVFECPPNDCQALLAAVKDPNDDFITENFTTDEIQNRELKKPYHMYTFKNSGVIVHLCKAAAPVEN